MSCAPRAKPVTLRFHMRWLKPNIRGSIYALLGHGSGPSPEHVRAAIERIREAMLELLGHEGRSAHPLLARRLEFATELQTLWYARSELMAIRASVRGEARARQEVEEITALFQGVLPVSLSRRSGRHG